MVESFETCCVQARTSLVAFMLHLLDCFMSKASKMVNNPTDNGCEVCVSVPVCPTGPGGEQPSCSAETVLLAS